MANSTKNFSEKFRNPLVRLREFPELFRFSSTNNQIKLVGLKANRFQIGAPQSPPEVTGAHDMTVRMHESFADNMAAAMLGGKKLTDEQLKKQIIAMRGSLPDEMKEDENEEPWSITFARHKPVTVTFDEQQFEVTIRGQQFTSGDREFRSMNISARYAWIITGTKMVRQGVVKISRPTSPSSHASFRPRRSVSRPFWPQVRQAVQRRLVSDGLNSRRLGKAGKLQAQTLVSEGGWLTVGWKLPSKDKLATGQAALDKQIEKK